MIEHFQDINDGHKYWAKASSNPRGDYAFSVQSENYNLEENSVLSAEGVEVPFHQFKDYVKAVGDFIRQKKGLNPGIVEPFEIGGDEEFHEEVTRNKDPFYLLSGEKGKILVPHRKIFYDRDWKLDHKVSLTAGAGGGSDLYGILNPRRGKPLTDSDVSKIHRNYEPIWMYTVNGAHDSIDEGSGEIREVLSLEFDLFFPGKNNGDSSRSSALVGAA